MSQDINDIDLSCYNNIIGLSRTTCECLDTNLDYESKSDLYVDELEGVNLNMINGAADCNKGNIWEIMQKARQNAIITYISDTTNKIMERAKLRRNIYTGAVGRRSFNQVRALNTTYAGVRLFCASIKGGILKINKINTLFTATGTITLYVYNNATELKATYTLNTVANKYCENILPSALILPLYDEGLDNLEYFFIYEYSALNMPKNNDIICNCSGKKIYFNTKAPYFNSVTTLGWSRYFMAGSVELNSIADLSDVGYSTSNYMNGLLLDVEAKCDTKLVLCSGEMDFTANPLSLSIAFAIRYKAGEYLLNSILSSDNINRYTMMDGEAMATMIGFYKEKYNDLIKVIAAKTDLTQNDCLQCEDKIKLQRRTIWS
jgi:hypothetical protein